MSFLFNCIILSALVVVGEILVYNKFPLLIKKILCRIHWIVDLAVSYGAYSILGPGTVTGLFAAAFVGIATSLLLKHERLQLL